MQAERTNEIDATAPVTEQASAWWVLLNEGQASAADHRAFSEWVTRSPERVAAYLQAARVAHVLRSPRTPWPETPADELIARALASNVAHLPSADASVLPRPPGTTPNVDAEPSHRRVFAMRYALAFAAILVAVAIGFYIHPRTERYQTALGEQTSVVLSDGSLVTLNTASAIKLDFDKSQRRIALLEGEALFEVAHDVTRPFTVAAGETTVRAVGTKFNVDRHAQALEVTVIEGRVEVSTGSSRTLLGAGEQMTLAPRTAPIVAHANVAAATAWTQRQLVFENAPLGDIVAELNRYNRQVIDIQSPELRDQQITGVFQSNDPASFLAFLRRIPDVTVEASPDQSRYIVRTSRKP